ncbi:uncharacterized protein TNCV_3433261 [Trichonephila clavipes]|nr:uncharacterized protein TNCV_3433261 [Trichonephila clavipes]
MRLNPRLSASQIANDIREIFKKTLHEDTIRKILKKAGYHGRIALKHGGGGVMVWGCMAANGVGRLTFIDSKLNHMGYINILKENLKQSAQDLNLGDDFWFQYGGITSNRRRYMVQTPSGMTTDSEAPYSSREGSVDPGGSSESVPLAAQQHRKTFKEKLKSLRRTKSVDVASGQKVGEESSLDKNAKEMSLRSKISKVLKKPLGRSLSMEHKKPVPALPPRGVVPDVVPSRPTAEKPLSASRGELSQRRPASQQQERRPKPPSKPGVETPV